MEGPIFAGAYARREICVTKSVGLDCSRKEIYQFCFVLLCIRGQIPSTRPPGGLYSEGRFNGGFFALRFWVAYIWRGLYMEGLYLLFDWYVTYIIICRLCDTQNVAHPQDALGPSYFHCQRSFVPWYKVESESLLVFKFRCVMLCDG